MKKILTRPVASQYSFHSRYDNKEDAREITKKLCGGKHAYYTKVREKGVDYWDVRTEN